MSAACTSTPSLPDKATVIAAAQRYINATLDGIGYAGPRQFELYWGQCNETDPSHGDIAVNFYFPQQSTLAAGEALMAKIVAFWRSNSTFSGVSAQSPGADQDAFANAGGFQFAANSSKGASGDGVSLTTSSCYNTAGPANPTSTTISASP